MISGPHSQSTVREPNVTAYYMYRSRFQLSRLVFLGARVYYMRNIMHDYSDHKCKGILQLTMDAVGKDSVITIDEMILLTKGT